MKETIEYYYNLDIDALEENDGKYHFKIENSDFFFVFYNRLPEELSDIYNVTIELKKKGIDVHNIIPNIKNEYITKINDYPYILFQVSNFLEKEDIFDMVALADNLVLNKEYNHLYRNNWAKLWMSKVDYFEYQVRELALPKQVVKYSFSYFVGLAENAISYVNDTVNKYGKIMNGKITLSHRRVYYPNYKLNYMNPLSFIFDLQVRDIAEYLKSMFFSNKKEDAYEDLVSYLKVEKLNIYEYQMLFARLLYPSFYFDIYDEVMNKEKSDEELLKVIKVSDDYEEFLKKAYLEISKYARIDKIDWIIN